MAVERAGDGERGIGGGGMNAIGTARMDGETTRREGRMERVGARRFAGFGGVSFGYDVAVVGGALGALAKDLNMNSGERGAAVGAAKFGAAMGAFGGAAAMRCFGRTRAAVMIVGTCSTVGAIACWAFVEASRSVAGFALGRIVLGVPVGALAVIVPAYTGESVDASSRGAVGASYELSVCAGMILANALTWFKPSKSLGLVLVSPIVLGFWSSIAFATCPESARWLLGRGDVEGARDALRASGRDENAVDAEIETLRAEVDDIDDAGFGKSLVDSVVGGMREAMEGEEYRAVRIALALALFNQLNASTSIINYSPRVLRNIVQAKGGTTSPSGEFDAFNLYTGLIVLCKTAGVAASIIYVDKFGRRPLLILGSVAAGSGLTFACFGYAVNSFAVTLVGMCAFILAYSVSFASVFWVLVSEFFSMRTKSACTALVTATLFVSGAISDLIFPVLLASTGAFTFAVYASMCFASALFVHVYVPETARLSLREVQALLGRKPSAYARVELGQMY